MQLHSDKYKPLWAIIVFALISFPFVARAGFLSFLGLDTAASADTSGLLTHNSQTIPLPEASAVPDQAAQDSANIAVDDNALLADAGPLGTSADMSAGDLPSADAISLYVVRQGDTLPVIAKMFSVSVNTIRWANDLSSSASVHHVRPA